MRLELGVSKIVASSLLSYLSESLPKCVLAVTVLAVRSDGRRDAPHSMSWVTY